jgi:cytidylate kinase
MIIAILGPAGSGKTIIARKTVSRMENARLISSDQFRRRAYGQLKEEFTKELGKHKNLVVDGTFYEESWLQGPRDAGAEEKVVEVFLDCSYGICLS